MAGFLKSNTASLANGSKVIQITGGLNCSFVGSGTAVYIDNTLLEGVSGTSPDPSGNSTITLRNTYTGSSIVNGTLVSFNTIEGLRDAIQRARELADTQVTNNSQLDIFLTNTTTSVDLELPSGIVTVSPYQYISGLVLDNDVRQYAMSQAQFEAIRAQNKERYVASGWVSFGNHGSGNQVNEYKSGLYTVLTTPNTLLIGKAGGVGGSKTDYASVHIDGVVFNLTNQFVLTLPSHPTSTQPDRMDMYGVESEKVEISAASPNAYQGGLRGVGAAVNLFTATEQQKKDFFAQNSNTTYIGSDGKIYQWQLYKIAFAGSTNGFPSPSEQGYSLNSFGDLWLKAGKNLLYFGNVLRLNDGGYHPSFNPLGAAKFVGDTFWYNTAASITSRADCFNPSKLLAGSGSIASGKSGRPEGYYYDAIYASGHGGICRDMRYYANSLSELDYSVANKDFLTGRYRGFEKITFSQPLAYTSVSFINNSVLIRGPQLGEFFTNATDGKINGFDILFAAEDGESPYVYLQEKYGDVTSEFSEGVAIAEKSLQSKAGGVFIQTDVAANPVVLLATPALASGWYGSWISPEEPSLNLSRKALINPFGSLVLKNGVWSLNSSGYDSIRNTAYNHVLAEAASVSICQYLAFSSQTEPSANASVYGSEVGLYMLFASSSTYPSYGVLLGESLCGIICKNDGSAQSGMFSITNINIDNERKLSNEQWNTENKHSPLTLAAPNYNSPAFKTLNYNVNINRQAFIQCAYTELKHNGTNWGDDGKITIVDNQSTKTDLNGNTVLVGTAKLKEPIGWVKLKV